ncbi:MAG: hypothetical protein ABIJ37_07445 [Pseudomonadota bacterium]
MPQPNVKELMVTGPLQDVSVAYRNKRYIGDRVFPIIDGVDPKAKIAVYQKGAWFRDEAGIRGPGARAPRGGFPISWVSIATKEYAFAKEVTDEDRRFARSKNAPPLKPDQDALEFCADKIDLSKERRIASLITAGTWADGAAGGEDAEGLWSPSDDTNTFLPDIATARKTIQKGAGVTPNVMIVDFATYEALKQSAAILDKIKYTQRGVLTAELLAAVCDLDEVLIGEAIYSIAKETKAGTDFTAAYIWEVNAGKGMGFIFYRPPAPGLKVRSAGYQCRIAYEDGSPRRSTTWREAAEHQDVYEVAEETDIIQVAADCGYLFKDTYAT